MVNLILKHILLQKYSTLMMQTYAEENGTF